MFKSGDKVICKQSSIISYWDENKSSLFDNIQNEHEYFDKRLKKMVKVPAAEKEVINVYDGINRQGKPETFLSFRKCNFVHPTSKFVKVN